MGSYSELIWVALKWSELPIWFHQRANVCTLWLVKDKWCFLNLMEGWSTWEEMVAAWVCGCVSFVQCTVFECVCALPLNGCYIIQKPFFYLLQRRKEQWRVRSKRQEESAESCFGLNCFKSSCGVNFSREKCVFQFLNSDVSSIHFLNYIMGFKGFRDPSSVKLNTKR